MENSVRAVTSSTTNEQWTRAQNQHVRKGNSGYLDAGGDEREGVVSRRPVRGSRIYLTHFQARRLITITLFVIITMKEPHRLPPRGLRVRLSHRFFFRVVLQKSTPLVMVKDTLTDLWESCLLQNDFKNTLCEIR